MESSVRGRSAVAAACRALVRGCASLVPRARRDEWTEEWLAELWVLWHGGEPWAGVSRPGPVRFVLGCVPHACWERWEGWMMVLATHRRQVRLLVAFALGVPGALAAALCGITLMIGISIAVVSHTAMAHCRGDRVEALMRLVESDEQPLAVRNRAVWALGQLGDPRALPVLERHYTGGRCDHARLLCQNELGKAIEGCRGSRSAVRWIWRGTFGPLQAVAEVDPVRQPQAAGPR